MLKYTENHIIDFCLKTYINNLVFVIYNVVNLLLKIDLFVFVCEHEFIFYFFGIIYVDGGRQSGAVVSLI